MVGLRLIPRGYKALQDFELKQIPNPGPINATALVPDGEGD